MQPRPARERSTRLKGFNLSTGPSNFGRDNDNDRDTDFENDFESHHDSRDPDSRNTNPRSAAPIHAARTDHESPTDNAPNHFNRTNDIDQPADAQSTHSPAQPPAESPSQPITPPDAHAAPAREPAREPERTPAAHARNPTQPTPRSLQSAARASAAPPPNNRTQPPSTNPKPPTFQQEFDAALKLADEFLADPEWSQTDPPHS